MTHVHEFQQVLWVTTPLGDGVVILHIDMGIQHNGTLLVGLESGQMKYFDSNQVRMCRNDTLGIGVERRVVANRDINVLCLMGKKGTVMGEVEDCYMVLFDGEEKQVQVKRKAVDHIR